MLQRSGRVAGLIEPCLPSPAKAPPSGPEWLHEIKHDGFRILARRDAKGVQLYTRNGNDFADRFSLVVATAAALPVRSCLIDGEAIVSDEAGLAVFELIRSWRNDHSAVLCAFDLLELDGEDLRRLPIAQGRASPAAAQPASGHRAERALRRPRRYHYRQACKLGCEGIVSKQLGSTYRSGRSRCYGVMIDKDRNNEWMAIAPQVQ
jgi:bifunctional non-homologous end joining protein LigD